LKINFPLLSALVIGFLPVSTVFGQNTSEPVYTITSESLLDNHCIDTPPLGDRFGWNGYCSCVPEGDEIAYEWGHVTALIGDPYTTGVATNPRSKHKN